MQESRSRTSIMIMSSEDPAAAKQGRGGAAAAYVHPISFRNNYYCNNNNNNNNDDVVNYVDIPPKYRRIDPSIDSHFPPPPPPPYYDDNNNSRRRPHHHYQSRCSVDDHPDHQTTPTSQPNIHPQAAATTTVDFSDHAPYLSGDSDLTAEHMVAGGGASSEDHQEVDGSKTSIRTASVAGTAADVESMHVAAAAAADIGRSTCSNPNSLQFLRLQGLPDRSPQMDGTAAAMGSLLGTANCSSTCADQRFHDDGGGDISRTDDRAAARSCRQQLQREEEEAKPWLELRLGLVITPPSSASSSSSSSSASHDRSTSFAMEEDPSCSHDVNVAAARRHGQSHDLDFSRRNSPTNPPATIATMLQLFPAAAAVVRRPHYSDIDRQAADPCGGGGEALPDPAAEESLRCRRSSSFPAAATPSISIGGYSFPLPANNGKDQLIAAAPNSNFSFRLQREEVDAVDLVTQQRRPAAASASTLGSRYFRRRPRKAAGVWFSLEPAPSTPLEHGVRTDQQLLQAMRKIYLRIRDDTVTVSILKRYLANKFRLSEQEEVLITCRGNPLMPSLTIQHVRDHIWLNGEASIIGQGIGFRSNINDIVFAKDHVMELYYKIHVHTTITLNLLRT